MRSAIFDRVFARLGKVAPELVHLFRRLHVELVGVELHAAGVGDGLAGTDAEQHVVRRGILLLEIVRIVGRDDRHVQLASDADKTVLIASSSGMPCRITSM